MSCGIDQALQPLHAGDVRRRRYCSARKSRFSRPTPCSPVIEPPSAMHSRRISAAQRLGAIVRAGVAAVEQDQRVQVAVAGVEDVGDADAVLAAERLDADQRLAEAAARHDAVLDDEVGAEAADRRERRLAALPDRHPLVGVLRDADFVGAGGADQRLELDELRVDVGGLAFELDEQHRRGVERIAGVHRGFGRLDRQVVHDLHRARAAARSDDARHRVAGGLERVGRRRARCDSRPDAAAAAA